MIVQGKAEHTAMAAS